MHACGSQCRSQFLKSYNFIWFLFQFGATSTAMPVALSQIHVVGFVSAATQLKKQRACRDERSQLHTHTQTHKWSNSILWMSKLKWLSSLVKWLEALVRTPPTHSLRDSYFCSTYVFYMCAGACLYVCVQIGERVHFSPSICFIIPNKWNCRLDVDQNSSAAALAEMLLNVDIHIIVVCDSATAIALTKRIITTNGWAHKRLLVFIVNHKMDYPSSSSSLSSSLYVCSRYLHHTRSAHDYPTIQTRAHHIVRVWMYMLTAGWYKIICLIISKIILYGFNEHGKHCRYVYLGLIDAFFKSIAPPN